MIKQRQSGNEVNIWLEVICQSSETAHQGLNEGSHTREMDKNWWKDIKSILHIEQISLKDNMFHGWMRKANQKINKSTL